MRSMIICWTKKHKSKFVGRMKRFLSICVCISIVLGLLYQPAFASLDPKLLSQPYNLTVEQAIDNEGNPDKGVVLHFKIDNFPSNVQDSEGSQAYVVEFEQKVSENGSWESIGCFLSEEGVEGGYLTAPGLLWYTTTWSDDFSNMVVSYRCRMGLKDYGAVGTPTINYTPWSNIATIGIKASSWALTGIKKAIEYGLVPHSINGDFTKPITREEFAELSVRLYEIYRGNKAEPAPESTFTDCKNPEVLKANKLGIVSGVGNNKFDPKALTNREQIAAMLNRAAKVMKPDADFSTAGAPKFTDENQVSGWALENVRYMAKSGFINGVGDNTFSPKGTCTREMAVIIALRVYEFYNK